MPLPKRTRWSHRREYVGRDEDFSYAGILTGPGPSSRVPEFTAPGAFRSTPPVPTRARDPGRATRIRPRSHTCHSLLGRLLWGSLIHPADIVLAAVLYTITGLGVTVGFHRGLTHGGYRAVRPLRIALAVAGSMSFQGDVIGWVATHRRHHAFTDRPGDPHSPYRYGTHLRGQLRGLLHAHVGRLFRNDRTPPELSHARLRSRGGTPPSPPTSSPTATSVPSPAPSRRCVSSRSPCRSRWAGPSAVRGCTA